MSDELIEPEAAIKFLREASIYFQSRATLHEDSNIHANMANAKTCERISEMIEARLIPVELGPERDASSAGLYGVPRAEE